MVSQEVDANYTAVSMKGELCGDMNENVDEFNQCNINNIASPDNVAALVGHNALIVGEDTEWHVNDAVWLLDLEVSLWWSAFALQGGITAASVCYTTVGTTIFARVCRAYQASVVQATLGPGPANGCLSGTSWACCSTQLCIYLPHPLTFTKIKLVA